jgi:hypothetical protein
MQLAWFHSRERAPIWARSYERDISGLRDDVQQSVMMLQVMRASFNRQLGSDFQRYNEAVREHNRIAAKQAAAGGAALKPEKPYRPRKHNFCLAYVRTDYYPSGEEMELHNQTTTNVFVAYSDPTGLEKKTKLATGEAGTEREFQLATIGAGFGLHYQFVPSVDLERYRQDKAVHVFPRGGADGVGGVPMRRRHDTEPKLLNFLCNAKIREIRDAYRARLSLQAQAIKHDLRYGGEGSDEFKFLRELKVKTTFQHLDAFGTQIESYGRAAREEEEKAGHCITTIFLASEFEICQYCMRGTIEPFLAMGEFHKVRLCTIELMREPL